MIDTLQHNHESEIEDLMNPKDELKKKIVTLAGTIRKWNDDNIQARKTVKKQLEEIVNLGLKKYNMEKTELRRLVEKIFRYHGISESWLRKLLPMELKDSSKIPISYQQRQQIEKERQILLLQKASESQQESEIREYGLSDGSTVESVSYQSAELELTPSTSENKQELELECVSEYDPQDHETLSLLSKEPIKVQNELSEAYKKIENLEADVRRLSEEFVARASLPALSETVSVVARIDPVKKVITWIRFDKATSI